MKYEPRHWLDDPHSAPDAQTPESIRRVNLARGMAWQEKNQSPYHCEHGSYVGYHQALAYKCPLCPEE